MRARTLCTVEAEGPARPPDGFEEEALGRTPSSSGPKGGKGLSLCSRHIFLLHLINLFRMLRQVARSTMLQAGKPCTMRAAAPLRPAVSRVNYSNGPAQQSSNAGKQAKTDEKHKNAFPSDLPPIGEGKGPEFIKGDEGSHNKRTLKSFSMVSQPGWP